MTQDTRKDRRVKIVSLNVRYKSATVDEFIENHAHDVSRGGIYIKTGSPFPPGTLLKFEIRLASDQALITGVGRVVWKRDSGQGSGERPAGMGVKFIKIDDPSKAVIDKLVNTRSDAGRAYEAESEGPAGEAPAAAAAGSRAPSPSPAPPAGNRAMVGKSTMLGIGALPGANAAAGARPSSVRPSAPPRPNSTGGGMFPKTNSEAEMPPKQEQTVMKQAAELLEEALREAGGSMEDVGNNPLFAPPPPAAPAPTVEAPVESAVTPSLADAGPVTQAEAARARAMVAEMSPAPKKLTDPPRTTRETPTSKSPPSGRVSSAPSARTSTRPPGKLSSAPPKPPAKKGGSGMLVVLGVAAAAAFVGIFYRDALFGSSAPAPAPAAPTVQAAATTAPSPEPPAPTATQAPAETATASASANAAPSAAPSASASAAPASASASAPAAATAAATTAAATPPPAPARPSPHPAAARPATPTKPASEAPAAPAAPAPEAPAAPAATAPSQPASTATAAPTAAPTATATAAKPAKPAKPADDNPY